ncbi:MAG: IS1595 family transposase [Kiritimatiellaeota bacterium]|nr:IS1595 family transposase [Kiritimatiellota bacterium]
MQKRWRLSRYRVKKILMCFCVDITAGKTALLLGYNRHTAERYFTLFRERILEYQHQALMPFAGEIELDESYFGARRVRGKRGRGAAGKTPVFGVLKRGGQVFLTVVRSCSKEELMPIIQGRILENATVYTDGWGAYDGLILNGYDHYRVFHSRDEFARGKCHVNGIESFWSYAKRRLAKFNGIASARFVLYLKECEFRFNNKGQDLFDILCKNVLQI